MRETRTFEITVDGQVIDLTDRDKEYIAARLSGMDSLEAMKKVNINPSRLFKIAEDGSIANYLKERLLEVGVTDELIMTRLKEGLDATRRVRTRDGKGYTDVGDATARLRYLETIFDLTRISARTEPKTTVNTTINNTVNFIDQKDLLGPETDIEKHMIDRFNATKQNRKRVVSKDVIEGEFHESE